jgi:hypothetical protein
MRIWDMGTPTVFSRVAMTQLRRGAERCQKPLRSEPTSVDVKKGKIAAFHVAHSEKGNIPVKKYKTHKKMAQTGSPHLVYASFQLAQMEDLGAEWIGYSYVDESGNEEIYWYPVEEIYDGDTGAIDYVPLSS